MNDLKLVQIPILFLILFIFLILNISMNIFFYRICYREIYKKLFFYWFSLVVVFILQMLAQNGNFLIIMSYSATLLPMTILTWFLYETYNEKLPYEILLPLYFIGFPLTFVLNYLNFGFTLVAMPFAVLTALPLLFGAHLVFIKNKNKSTTLQKFLGGIFVIMPIHCLNFAFFRMDEKNQIWGWFIAWGIYQFLSTLLPAFALEEIARNENKRVFNYQAEIAKLKNEIENLTSLDQKNN